MDAVESITVHYTDGTSTEFVKQGDIHTGDVDTVITPPPLVAPEGEGEGVSDLTPPAEGETSADTGEVPPGFVPGGDSGQGGTPDGSDQPTPEAESPGEAA